MKRVVLLVCDGLRSDMINPNFAPNLNRIKRKACVYSEHKSVFPSTTRTTAASIATGCYPGTHGLEGNCMALDDGGGLKAMSVGPADFREKMRQITGRTLRVPTISERITKLGDAVVFSNVSPGAAYFHDPDGHGYVFHRCGSYGPGLRKISRPYQLDVSHDQAGDKKMTERFCDEILETRKPPYSLLWLCEPDHTQHAYPLGSPEHIAAIIAADENVKQVNDTIDKQIQAGEKILFILASDHGHETVSKTLPLSSRLVEAGLKKDESSSEIVVASNGLSANIYMSLEGKKLFRETIDFLKTVEELGSIYWGKSLESLGHRTDSSLAISVTTKYSEEANQFGIKGQSIAIYDPLHQDTNPGCGQHGGLGKFEQSPFLMFKGFGVEEGRDFTQSTSAIDLAPTILKFLGVSHSGMDGRPLRLFHC